MPDETHNSYVLHLNLGSIQGESSMTLHTQEIEISSISWGATNSAVRSAQGTTKGGKPTVSEITVVKHIDKSTALIFNALVSSTQIKTAKISMSKSTGSVVEDHMVITLTNAYITSQQVHHSRELKQKGLETVTLNYQTLNIDYKVQLPSGLLAAGSSASYDLTKGS